MVTSYYSIDELKTIGLKCIGKNVRISRYANLYGADEIVIGNDVRIDDYVVLSGKIAIGNNVHIACYCGLFGSYGIELHDFAGLSARVLIYSATDDYSGKSLTNPTVPNKYRDVQGGRVILSRHTIIGAGSIIMHSVTVGEGAAVGAMSMVVKSVNPWTICMGSPARFVKERSRELLDKEKSYLDSIT
ncbi:MAG: acyltransferase [Spirochaetes bacterium]|nr:acyltransferase [Spirochaetota bacterium]